MGWSDLIRWRDPRIKATVVGVAASLAEAIIESTNRLQVRLRDEGFAWKNPARADTDECLLECTIFEWFLREGVLDGFGGQADAIRQALAGRVLIDLQRSGMSTTCLEGFEGGRRERFAEYAEALDMSLSLQPLGALAWRRISGREEPSERMTMLLAMRASGALLALRGLGRNYRLVDLPQSPSRVAGQE